MLPGAGRNDRGSFAKVEIVTDVTGQAIRTERPYLLIVCALLGFLGCVSLVAGTLVAQQLVPDHDWVAETISDLAAGRMEIVMDVALYGFAAGIIATALAAAHAHLGGIGWSGGILALALLAAVVTVIAARNEYGDGDDEGVVIHIYLVYALGLLFALVPLLMSTGAARDSRWSCRALRGLGILWAVASPVFFLVPTAYDGLYERLLGLVAAAVVCVLCAVFLKRGRRALHRHRAAS